MRRHVVLFLLVLVTTTLAGVEFHASFVSDLGRVPYRETWWQSLAGGLRFSIPTVLILTAHEMGHYVACRYYGIRASLPYFLPLPSIIPVPGVGLVGIGLFGTLGAVIRIREPLRFKRQVFDIGVAGPIAGIVVAAPIMVWALASSRVVAFTPTPNTLNFGDPLIMQLVQSWFFTVNAGFAINLHPAGFAAWFGMFMTGLNLVPAGQLDGGHVAYACFGRRATWLTGLSLLTALIAGWRLSPMWLVWFVFICALLSLFGWRHAPVLDEDAPLGAGRWMVALVALALLVLCFIPVPLQ